MIRSNGAGAVTRVTPGPADWRHGRPGRTGERSRRRGEPFVDLFVDLTGLLGYGPMPSDWRTRRGTLHRTGRRVLRFGTEPRPGSAMRRVIRRLPGKRGGSWNGGRPGDHGVKAERGVFA